MKRRIKITENRLRSMIRESVRQILNETSMWADGTKQTYAYHKACLSGEDDQEMADFVGEIYDKFSHNEMNVQEVIDTVLDYGVDYSDDEESVIPRSCHKLGKSNDGRYLLTYETFTGTYDVWEIAAEMATESRRRGIIRNVVKSMLRENAKSEVFTIDVYNITADEGMDDIRYAGRDYDSADEAIEAARACAQQYADMDDVIHVTVFGGEYRDAMGNIVGEPHDIYTISTKDKPTTTAARHNAGYVSATVDEYLQ